MKSEKTKFELIGYEKLVQALKNCSPETQDEVAEEIEQLI